MGEAADSQDSDGVQLRRVVGNQAFPVLLQGFLIPGQHGDHNPRFLILMEKLGRRSQVPTEDAKKHFHLSDQEHELVRHVAVGRTNREIAEGLEISEHTVKEQIQTHLEKNQ